jgi:hypothetical protein
VDDPAPPAGDLIRLPEGADVVRLDHDVRAVFETTNVVAAAAACENYVLIAFTRGRRNPRILPLHSIVAAQLLEFRAWRPFDELAKGCAALGAEIETYLRRLVFSGAIEVAQPSLPRDLAPRT